MKKLISFVLALALSVAALFSLVSCEKEDEYDSSHRDTSDKGNYVAPLD